MIEVIYKEENQETPSEETFVQIPRNIRQIGLADENCKIYMEDYVYTFLVRLARSEDKNGGEKARTAVLTGESKWSAGTSYLFIKGALLTEDMEAAVDHVDFTEEIWQKIHEEQEKYFGEQEIVGWFFSQPQLAMEVNEVFARVHLKHFGGEKVLMLMEPQEREDAFFRYENGYMVKQNGYYIYYEKNSQMQGYMIEKNQELQPEITEKCEDEAVKNFRKIITGKKQEAEERASVFSYAATACLAVAVLVVGVNFYQNYQSMKNIETEIQQASSIIVEEVTPVPDKRQQGAEDKTMASAETKVERKETLTQFPDEECASGQKKKQKSDQTEKQKSGQELGQETSNEEVSDQETLKQETSKQEKREKTEQKAVQTEQKEIDQMSEETAGDEVYREESDVRKAQRRKEAQEEKEAASSGIHETYVIKPGDTIFQISMARYGTMDAMGEICRLNGLSLEEIIYPGQVIVLP